MDGALHVYKRENSRFWQCATYLGSRNYRQTTKEESLAAAKDFARDWYMERCVEDRQRRRGGVSLLNDPVQPLPAEPGPPFDGRRRQAASGVQVLLTLPKRSRTSSRLSRSASAMQTMSSRSPRSSAFT